MGYRSQVAIAFDSSLLPIWRKHTEEHEEYIQSESSGYDIDEDEGGICTVELDCIKWNAFSDFQEINAMDAAISEFSDFGDDELFQFIRVGESTDDIQERGSLWHFQVNRTIELAE